MLKQTYSQTRGRDGYVQVDIPPHSLLLQAQSAIAEAQILWHSVGWRNLMLRIPATQIMLPVIAQLIRDRINVNATFVFSQTTYDQVGDAYLRGLESLIQQGESVSEIAGFTSFSINRLDAVIYPPLAGSLETTSFGIAQANILYQQYRNICQSGRWRALCKKKAKPLGILWHCTNLHPQVPWGYIQFMAFPKTAIVLSPLTLETYMEVSLLPTSLIENLKGAERILTSLPQT